LSSAEESTAAKGAGRKIEIEDLYRFRLISDPQVSPDGRTVAYVQTRLRKRKNDYASNIWLAAADGSLNTGSPERGSKQNQPVKFTGSLARDMYPRWSPRGDEIAFVSTRAGKPQIWIIPVGGGEARQLTRVKRGVGEFEWSPDGRWIAFACTVDNDLDKRLAAEARSKGSGAEPGDSDSENREPGASGEEGFAAQTRAAGEWEEDEGDQEQPEDRGDYGKVFTRLHFKADGEGLVERRQHFFIVPSKGGEPRQITEGDWDARSPRWSPRGDALAFLSNQEPDADYRNIQDIFTITIDDNGRAGEPRRVTGHDSAIMSMDWLPSGDGFAVFAHRRIDEAAIATNNQVWTISLDGQVRELAPGFDRPVGAWLSGDLRSGAGEVRPRFGKDGSTVYFPVTNEGNVHIYSVSLQGGEPKRVLGGERHVLNFGVARDGIVFAASTATSPNDLFRVDLDGGNERRLAGVNDDVVPGIDLSEPVEFWLDRPDGGRVQGWMLLPPGYRQGEKYPLVLQIHGGPHMSYGNTYFHEFQLLAAQGNIVLYTNPRGSQGYGQAFSDAILADWGGIDYEDLMACVDYAIGRGDVDEARLGVAGGSYGGYMTTWVIGHTQRFKAAVAMRMISNVYSAWGSGDFTWMLWNWEFRGTPQERTALYLELSPISYVSEMRTPLLITHAEDDLRANIEQADQLYTALKVLKRDVKMVRFPSGGHDVSRTGKPSLRVDRLRHILDWFEEHLHRAA
jgi:dipeptidyl aminopeptidase/acylaminoacyl peptidase